jgi:anti-anti-sigma factor
VRHFVTHKVGDGASDPVCSTPGTEPGQRSVVLALHGELDLAVAAETRRLLELELTYGNDVELEVDALEFMDLTGVAALLGANAHAQNLNREFRITGLAQLQVRQLLALTGTDAMLPLKAQGRA